MLPPLQARGTPGRRGRPRRTRRRPRTMRRGVHPPGEDEGRPRRHPNGGGEAKVPGSGSRCERYDSSHDIYVFDDVTHRVLCTVFA